jgi:hypothetical protein
MRRKLNLVGLQQQEFEAIKKLKKVDQARFYGGAKLCICGGDPLLWSDVHLALNPPG